ncbi:hypothetical protein DS259_23620 [Salmonella enterica subsp. indica]|nr:hypothetical protein [Salmonella enterica subsp. indica]
MNVNMAAPLTAIFKLRACTEVQAFCLYVSPKPRGGENPRPGFDIKVTHHCVITLQFHDRITLL